MPEAKKARAVGLNHVALEVGDIFTKAPNVLRGMGLAHLSKNETATRSSRPRAWRRTEATSERVTLWSTSGWTGWDASSGNCLAVVRFDAVAASASLPHYHTRQMQRAVSPATVTPGVARSAKVSRSKRSK